MLRRMQPNCVAYFGTVRAIETDIEERMGSLTVKMRKLESQLVSWKWRDIAGTTLEIPQLKDGNKYSIKFLTRTKECLQNLSGHRWEKIKLILDKVFHDIQDCWWEAMQNQLESYEPFEEALKNKY